MKLKNILSTLVLGLGLASCANEAPFIQGEQKEGEGKFLSHILSVEVKTNEAVVRAASDVPDVNDFTVSFFKAESTSGKAYVSYPYPELPDVVTLPVGSYKVKAYYGGDHNKPAEVAKFNAPYYLGESEVFEVEKNKIVDNLDPVVCKLANIKVSVDFDIELKNKMSVDSKVTVTVGQSETLDFDLTTEGAGFFAYVEGSNTLVASFSGTVDGDFTEETKSYPNVAPGVHYKINFKLHPIDPKEPGNVNPGDEGEEIKVDAVVNLEDMTGDGGVDITPGEEFYLEDDRYPKDEPNIPIIPDDPNIPDDPTPSAGPTIKAGAGIDLDKVNIVEDDMQCILYVESSTGITKFDVDIISDKLTPQELKNVGLDSHLDMVNPGDLEGPLSGLGFPVNVGGEKRVEFNITGFLPMLGALGAAEHTFKLSVSDENGTTEKELKLKTIE